MIKGMSKATSLIVAAATILSIVPASAANYKKVDSEDGIIYDAVAYKDGAALIDGEIEDIDGAYYLNDGNYLELEDVDSGSDYTSYGTKYANVDEGDYFVDLETGSVTDDDLNDDDLDDAASALRKKIKKSDRYLDSISTPNTTVFGDTDIADLTEIAGNKFGESWYEANIAEDKSASSNISKTGLTAGGNPYFTVYTDTRGNYIDADYNLGKIKVSTTNAGIAVTTSAAVTIENTKDTYDLRGGDDTYAKIKQSVTLGQDSNYIYRYAIISVTTTSDKDGQVFINNRAFNITTGAPNSISTVDLKVIQKISKTQDGDDIDDAEYSKTVTNYVISDDDAKLIGNDETNYLNLAKDTTGKTQARVIGGKLVLFQVEENSDDDNVTVQAATLKSKNGYYYTDLEESTTITAEFNDDLDKTAFDTDVDGNLYVIDGGYVKTFDGTDDWDKVYKVDGSMDALSVYDKNNMVLWSQDDEVYSLIGKTTTDGDTTVETPVVSAGWAQATDGTWTYINTDGTKATGWLNLGGVWYYLKADGVMATGWVLDGSTWYYLNPVSTGTQGAMKTGWILDGSTWYFLSGSGAMKTGWINDNGTWYYLYSNGAMAANTVINGYRLSSSGALI
ncbi:cell wall-binding protein [Clostridium beijerinckii]|nr:cell wall-binding protein [Clostridium beijerinckii]